MLIIIILIGFISLYPSFTVQFKNTSSGINDMLKHWVYFQREPVEKEGPYAGSYKVWYCIHA